MTRSTKQIHTLTSDPNLVSVDSPIITECLPLKFVHYPNLYGCFIMFSESPSGEKYFCECSKVAIENHFKLRGLENSNIWSNNKISAPLSSHFFPNPISEKSLTISKDLLLKFKSKICHRCNMATPSVRYCHPMYGGNFTQHYGWYINQTEFRLGIRNLVYVEDYAPEFFITQIKEIHKRKEEQLDFFKITEIKDLEYNSNNKLLEKEIEKLSRTLKKEIENITREEFGFRKIGEGNVSETILTKIIEKIYFNYQIQKHYRPAWLEGLELDIYIPDLKIGIEYQGQQHFFPIKAWGGSKSLENVKARDAKKKQICIEKGIKLIEVDYTEPLEEEYIRYKTRT